MRAPDSTRGRRVVEAAAAKTGQGDCLGMHLGKGALGLVNQGRASAQARLKLAAEVQRGSDRHCVLHGRRRETKVRDAGCRALGRRAR